MNFQAKKSTQTGFTIIELVVVILLLGILAATALPRFLDVTDEAHDAVFTGVASGFTTGVALYRAQWVAEGQPSDTLIDAGGFNLYASETGYPRSASLEFDTAGAGFTEADSCAAVFNAVLQPSGRPIVTTDVTDALDADLGPAREVDVETAAAATPTADFVSVLERDAATPTVATTTCSYYYVGQFRAGTDAAQVSVPFFSYNFKTGVIDTTNELDLVTD